MAVEFNVRQSSSDSSPNWCSGCGFVKVTERLNILSILNDIVELFSFLISQCFVTNNDSVLKCHIIEKFICTCELPLLSTVVIGDPIA